MYADYVYYKKNWSGKIPEESYNFVSARAKAAIDYVTFNRITPETVTENVKLCQCEICDYLYALDQQSSAMDVVPGRGVIKSETVEDWRQDYGVAPISQEYSGREGGSSVDGVVMNICRRWLVRPVNLMYVGVNLG